MVAALLALVLEEEPAPLAQGVRIGVCIVVSQCLTEKRALRATR